MQLGILPPRTGAAQDCVWLVHATASGWSTHQEAPDDDEPLRQALGKIWENLGLDMPPANIPGFDDTSALVAEIPGLLDKILTKPCAQTKPPQSPKF
jgi:hypothetical protein